MTLAEQEAILTIALFAAFADGVKADTEREEIRRIAQSLADASGSANLARLYQDVLLRRVQLASATGVLSDAGQRNLAFEMAVCVCDADGRQSDAERQFLATLRQQLQLDSAQTAGFEREADAMVAAAETVVPAAVPAAPAASAAPTPVTAVLPAAAAAELDKSILNYALLTGALELLPQSWASMAIIPLQVKMVYGIGQAHGVQLDQGHIREFIAAAGVGITSQYLEQFGRKLLGGLLGGVAGKMGRSLGGAATGMAMSFATTYALGQVARRYYAGGRVMSTALLRDSFQELLVPARQMQQQYLPQIREKAATLDAGSVMAMVRGR
jgi:uncharacterized protein (DUF697 family)/DnaJ-domain-containing protein 1